MKTINFQIAFLCTVLFVFSSCTNTEPQPEGESQPKADMKSHPIAAEDSTLGSIEFSAAHERAETYGAYLGDKFGDSACIAPRYWDVGIEELLAAVISQEGEEKADYLRIYLGRDPNQEGALPSFELMLVSIKDGQENTANFHDLITPCPSTCQHAASSLQEAYFTGMGTTIDECQANYPEVTQSEQP